MASKKKAKSGKKAKKPAGKKKAVKKTKKKVVKKKVVARKPKAGKKAPAKKAAKKKSAPKKSAPKKPVVAAVPSGERIGIVTHYYSHLQVAIIQVDAGMLRTGDTVHIKGHTSDFSQVVESMEVDHVHVDQVGPGQSFGLRVKDHAREHDVVYKTPRM